MTSARVRPTNPQLDAEVRARLSGRRLVCEVDWEPWLVGEIRQAWAFRPGNMRGYDDFVRAYPAISVVYLVLHGTEHYAGNEFWTRLRLMPAEQSRVALAFETALGALGLETFPHFEEERARRFVARILAHGGIPASLVPDFLAGVLFPAIRRSPGATGAEVVARWRADRPASMPRTIERFLLTGGRTAVGLLDRLIELARIPRADLEAGAATGLPAAIVRAFLSVPVASVPVPRAALPRPSVHFSPDASNGPVLRLPPLTAAVGTGLTWEVDDGSGTSKAVRGYPRRDDDRHPLVPADAWRVVARRGDMTELDFAVEGFGPNRLVCFDASGGYLPDIEGIEADGAWIITPPGIGVAAVEGDTRRLLGGETVRMHGAWSGYLATWIDLHGVLLLVAVSDGAAVGTPTDVSPPGGQRVTIVEPPLAMVVASDGLEIRSAHPTLVLPAGAAWQVSMLGPGWTRGHDVPAGDLPARVELATLAPPPDLGPVRVSVTGPLASDVYLAYLLVPELVIDVPREPVAPGAGDVTVHASCPSRAVRLAGAGRERTTDVVISGAASRGELWIFGRDHQADPIRLLITIPRIRWATTGADDVPDFGTTICPFTVDDLGERITTLTVSAGVPGVPTHVDLETLAGVVVQPLAGRPTDSNGQFVVDLGRMIDTARHYAAAGLRVAIGIGGRRIIAASTATAQPAQPVDATLPPLPATTLLFDRAHLVTVRAIEQRRLIVDGDGWIGMIAADYLPAPIETYRVGDTLTAVATSQTDVVKLDARLFDPDAFALGESVTAEITRVNDYSITARARGHDLRADAGALPPDRPPRTWRAGDRITGRISAIIPPTRTIRLSAVAPAGPVDQSPA